MYCITREDMKFGEYFIPARTKAQVINTPKYNQADIPGLYLEISISLWQMAEKKNEGVPITKLRIDNEFGDFESQMVGIVVSTNGKQVFIDAGDKFYSDSILSEWDIKKIFGDTLPENIEKAEFSRGYKLSSVINYLDSKFSEWVQSNCDFRKLTKKDIENGEGFDGAEPGDRILSDTGLGQFYSKQLEYQKKLETIGFTYEFKGGLIWG